MGAPRPLVKSIQIESTPSAHARNGTPEATTALGRRAPSTWTAAPPAWATSQHGAVLLERPHGPPGEVVGLLERDDRGAGHVEGAGAEDGGHLLGREVAPLAVDLVEHDARRHRGATRLRAQQVGPAVDDDGVAPVGQGGHGHVVAHRPGHEEQRRLGAEQLGHPVLEAVDRGVLALLVVAHLGLGDGAAHARRGTGGGVAHEVDAGPVHAPGLPSGGGAGVVPGPDGRPYGERDRARGTAASVAWLVEEVGELAQAVRKGDADAQLHELGDVLAWLASIADQLGLSLDDAAARYAGGCPRCGATPCACP